jgi:hypothetical protein
MAWGTQLHPDEELIIEDRTRIRIEGNKPVRILIDSVGEQQKVVKRKIGAADK